MTFSNYLSLVSQFFFKKAHTFSFRLGSERVSVSVVSGEGSIPTSVSLGQAMQIVNHFSGAPLASTLTESFTINSNLTVSVTLTKV
jgi:hypothetical protein